MHFLLTLAPRSNNTAKQTSHCKNNYIFTRVVLALTKTFKSKKVYSHHYPQKLTTQNTNATFHEKIVCVCKCSTMFITVFSSLPARECFFATMCSTVLYLLLLCVNVQNLCFREIGWNDFSRVMSWWCLVKSLFLPLDGQSENPRHFYRQNFAVYH